MTEPADRAGEPERRTKAAWDERHRGCCKKSNVWGLRSRDAPVRHCSRPRRLDWPLARLGFDQIGVELQDFARGCPRVELSKNSPRSLEREPAVLNSRRGVRMIF
jgi:hypothetical protein